MIDLNSDQPVNDQNNDRFQRYEFSKRIATTIVKRKRTDCLVIGIYGAWGEGKTSVLNFIDKELKQNGALSIQFNPWRYSDEDTLVKFFLAKVCKEIGKDLHTKKEKNAKKATQAAELIPPISLFGFDLDLAKPLRTIGEKLGEVDLEDLKDRVNQYLTEINHKLVIFIDDIDRLEKQEIHSILRLVKLTADFKNTVYILSFDEKMVAAAIGDRFGSGNEMAGTNFLEKIIHLPLKIPVAQEHDLAAYCNELIDDVLVENQITLDSKEHHRFKNAFGKFILPILKTPRQVIRYVNALSFSLPMLTGEANTVDLMLFDALKIFYPEYYEFVKHNSEYFLYGYPKPETGEAATKKQEITEHLQKLGKELTIKQKRSVEQLLVEFFPLLKRAFENKNIWYDDQNRDIQWFKDKRVCSREYFSRYFSYAVTKGTIPDILFSQFIKSVPSKSIEELVEDATKFIELSDIAKFLTKLSYYASDYDYQTNEQLLRLISSLSNLFNLGQLQFRLDAFQGVEFIENALNKCIYDKKGYTLATELIESATCLNFAFYIMKICREIELKEKKFANEQQYQALVTFFIQKVKSTGQGFSFFEKFNGKSSVWQFLEYWNESNHQDLNEYVKVTIEQNISNIAPLLNIFVSEIYTTQSKDPYRGNFEKKTFDDFKVLIDIEFIINKIKQHLGDSLKEAAKFLDRHDNTQTNENIMKQFAHWWVIDDLQQMILTAVEE
jgi:predicted KAP-like P-loop ATPase